MRRWALLVLVLVLSCATPVRAADEAERQRLVALFSKVQDVLLTINSEMIQYGERIQVVSTRLRDRSLWTNGELDQVRATPMLRELNKLKVSLANISVGLEQKYSQVRAFQPELRDKYPTLQTEIDTYYALFDRVYESSRERHRRANAQMTDLKRWFKTQVAAADAATAPEASEQVAARPRYARR